MRLLSDILYETACHVPSRPALSDPDEALTYAELAGRAAAVSRGLRQAGVCPGDRVCLVLPNSVEFAVAHFGVLGAGAVSVPCDHAISPANLAAVEADCSPRLTLRPGALAARGWTAAPAPPPAPSRGPGDLATLMYTTGTTGRPKGVMLGHDHVFAALRNICGFVGYTAEDREVVTLPLSHNFGLGHLYCNLMNGGAVHVEPGLVRVGRVLRKIGEWRATGFPTTPAGIALLLDRYGPAFVECARDLRFLVINSAPLLPERVVQLRAALPATRILVYYGLTEASRSTFIDFNAAGPAKYRSVGRPMPGIDIRLTDAGEIAIRGRTVTPGYWNDPARTARVLRGGWLHTGDLGRIDPDGYLEIVGRLEDVVNVGGYKVNPQEVEAVLAGFPGVAAAGVFGLDRVEAAVVCPPGLDFTALLEHCRARLEPFKVPAAFHRVDDLPRTGTGKLLRRELATRLGAATDASPACDHPPALPCST
jgi:long-chain acyl-CoA synthetase